MDLTDRIHACRLCADRFAATATQHRPRPVPWFRAGTPILVAGQAPGMRVHQAGQPFLDRSGDRLRDWMGLRADQFYDRALVSVVPTAFCFPGYDSKGADLPPPPLCWETWHDAVLAEIGRPQLSVIVGSYAIRRHLDLRGSVSAIVAGWRALPPGVFALPHPSWRNNAWLKKNPWFGDEVLPALKTAVAAAL